MHPGFHEQVAMLRYQELVATGLREQFVASVLPPSANTLAVLTALRQQIGTFLVRAGQRLQGVHAVTREGLRSVAVEEQDAIASSDEPMRWLSPYRLP